MVCDFFYPNVGGVESHIYALSQCFIRRGHRVTVISHSYGDEHQRQSVRFMARGLKVYYLPMLNFYRQATFPTIYSTLPVIRDILIREEIDILHGHSQFSTLACESLINAQAMGIPTVFTDHSLFGFANLSAVLWNWFLEGVLLYTDQVICVSHICKENSVLRFKVDPKRVFVIPNAVDCSQFLPDPSAKDLNYSGLLGVFYPHVTTGIIGLSEKYHSFFIFICSYEVFSLTICVYVIVNHYFAGRFSDNDGTIHTIRTPTVYLPFLSLVTIVVVSRLVYRKGLDLLVAIIPPLCAIFPNLRFFIGGDGPKRLELEEVREFHQLHSRVRFFGHLLPAGVRSLLIQGDIFLNTSLSEAFCIAILEAVSCGLLVVTTSVGGVPEVLPSELIRMAPPKASELTKCVAGAIQEVIDSRRTESTKPDECTSPDGDMAELCGSQQDDSITFTDSLLSREKARCQRMHQWVCNSYSWSEVARRTEVVYWAAKSRTSLPVGTRAAGYLQHYGPMGLFVAVLCYVHWCALQFMCWIRPKHTICKAPYLKVPIEDASEDEFRDS